MVRRIVLNFFFGKKIVLKTKQNKTTASIKQIWDCSIYSFNKRLTSFHSMAPNILIEKHHLSYLNIVRCFFLICFICCNEFFCSVSLCFSIWSIVFSIESFRLGLILKQGIQSTSNRKKKLIVLHIYWIRCFCLFLSSLSQSIKVPSEGRKRWKRLLVKLRNTPCRWQTYDWQDYFYCILICL